MAVVSRRLGHSRSSFTIDTYTRVMPQPDHEAAKQIAETASGGSNTGRRRSAVEVFVK